MDEYVDGEPTAYKNVAWNPLDFADDDPAEQVEVSVDLVNLIEHKSHLMVRKYLPEEDCHYETNRFIDGREVGDDRVDVSPNPLLLGRCLSLQEEVFMMRTSWKDTHISKFDWNFCEVTSQIPCAPQENLDYARKTNFSNLGFTDAPVVRLITDVQKADKSHSSTDVGKSGMLATRMETPWWGNSPYMMLSSWLQDGCLNTPYSSEPKYLSRQVAGSGARPLWNLSDNTFLYMLAYKGGGYRRVYASAINEAKTCVNNLDIGYPTEARLCALLREKEQWLLHMTYASTIVLPSRGLNLAFEKVKDVEPLYLASGTSAAVQSVENRLIQTRDLITRKGAEIELMRYHRITQALFGYSGVATADASERLLKKNIRSTFGLALRANSAVKNLLDRRADGSEVTKLLQEGYSYSSSGILDLTRDLVDWICSGGTGETYSVMDIQRSHDMFVRTEVNEAEAMLIPEMVLKPIYNYRASAGVVTKAEVGLWQVTTGKEEWGDIITQELIALRDLNMGPLTYQDIIPVFIEHREWVNDDALILEECRRVMQGLPRSGITIVTADEKMCRNVSRSLGHQVLMIRPGVLLPAMPDVVWDANLELTLDQLRVHINLTGVEIAVPGLVEKVILDLGSIMAFAVRMERNRNQHGLPTGTTNAVKLEHSGVINGKRFASVLVQPIRLTERPILKIFSANMEEATWTPYPKGSHVRPGFLRRLRTRFTHRTQGTGGKQ